MKNILKPLLYVMTPISMFFGACTQNDSPFVSQTKQAKFWQTEMNDEAYSVKEPISIKPTTKDSLRNVLNNAKLIVTTVEEDSSASMGLWSKFLVGAFLNSKGDTVAKVERFISYESFTFKDSLGLEKKPIDRTLVKNRESLDLVFSNNIGFHSEGEKTSENNKNLSMYSHKGSFITVK